LSSCEVLKDAPTTFRQKIPTGDFEGTSTRLVFDSKLNSYDLSEDPPAEVEVTLFPIPEEYNQGVGILKINNRSHKFFWESDTFRPKAWNISFSKDNNIYSNFNESFNFTGLLMDKPEKLALEGTLHFKPLTEGEKISYNLAVYQQRDPGLEIPKDGLIASQDTVLDLEVKNLSTLENLQVIINGTGESTVKDQKLELASIKEEKDKSILKVKIPAELETGDYNLYIIRDEQFKSAVSALKIEGKK
jgi:hypothetical protein